MVVNIRIALANLIAMEKDAVLLLILADLYA